MSTSKPAPSEGTPSAPVATPEKAATPRDASRWRIAGITTVIGGLVIAGVTATAISKKGEGAQEKSRDRIHAAAPEEAAPNGPPVLTEAEKNMKGREAFHKWQDAEKSNMYENILKHLLAMESLKSQAGMSYEEIGVDAETVRVRWEMLAESFWQHAGESLTPHGIHQYLEHMDVALKYAQRSREEIGATPSAIKELYVAAALEGWERANMFRNAGVPFAAQMALGDFHTALKFAELTPENVGITNAMIARVLQGREAGEAVQ